MMCYNSQAFDSLGVWHCNVTYHVCTVHDSRAKSGRKERCLGLGMERQENGEMEEWRDGGMERQENGNGEVVE